MTRLFEPVVLLAALATIPLTLLEQTQATRREYDVADWVIWLVFVVEYVALIATASNRGRFARRNWLSVFVIVLSFPLLPSLLALARVARLARLARLFRLARLGVVGAKAIPALKATLGRRGLVTVAAVTILLVGSAAGALTLLEPSLKGDFWTALWWAVVTTTTVGYGDVSPQTAAGRIVAVVLMITGIGLTATLAASVAAFFVGQEREDDSLTVHDRLDRMEALLKEIADRH